MTAVTDRISLIDLLERNVAANPSGVAVTFDDGSGWTWIEALHNAYGSAAALKGLGLGHGDRVAIALPNGADFLRAWWGATALGAVVVPVNLSYRGDLLLRLIRLSNPAFLVTDEDFGDRIVDLSLGAACPTVQAADLRGLRSVPAGPPAELRGWSSHALMLTSGTTGPSKLVNVTYMNSLVGGDVFFGPWGLGASDRFLVDLPLYHSAAFRFVHASVYSGVSMVVRQRPALDAYWEVARDSGITAALIFGSMSSYLMARPVRSVDREHSIALIGAIPLPSDPRAFMRRFGIGNLHAAWGSTEIPAAVHVQPGVELRKGSVGLVRNGFDLRIVDEYDIEVPVGQPGQAIVRATQPWVITHEYVDNPVATNEAWRNGWFHSGDIMRRDADGYVYFIDRLKDVVRRRGENISSYEVESVLMTHPEVSEAACVAVPRDTGDEDEVKVWVVAKHAGLPADELLEFCAERMPHFMVPRFFEITDALPRTSTGKIEKAKLRERGNGCATWDSVAEGFSVTRTGIVRR